MKQKITPSAYIKYLNENQDPKQLSDFFDYLGKNTK